MKTIRKELKIKGLYVISMKLSGSTWCRLMSESDDIPVRNYTSRPIIKITDFIKLFNESLAHLNWEGELTEDHGKAILEMERKIKIDKLNKWYVEF